MEVSDFFWKDHIYYDSNKTRETCVCIVFLNIYSGSSIYVFLQNCLRVPEKPKMQPFNISKWFDYKYIISGVTFSTKNSYLAGSLIIPLYYCTGLLQITGTLRHMAMHQLHAHACMHLSSCTGMAIPSENIFL